MRGASKRRQGHFRERGQAMIEFAMVCVLFLSILFTILESSIWAIETMAATESAENLVRLLASDTSAATQTADMNTIAGNLKSAMPGTAIVVDSSGTCPTSSDAVYTQYNAKPTVVLCFTTNGEYIDVGIVGYGNSFVSPGFGFRWMQGVPIYVHARTHTLGFRQ